MTTGVFVAVLAAAALHAMWNALVKGAGDKDVAMLMMVAGQGVAAAVVLCVVPAPAPQSWPYIALAVALHTGYQIFLVAAYRIGDLTQVYPIARGSAPLMVAAISVLVLDVVLSAAETAAVVLIALGIVSLALVRRTDGDRNGRAVILALVTGCFITAYSLADGLGARAAGTALGFFGWAALLNTLAFAAYTALTRRGAYRAVTRTAILTGLVSGPASFAAYAIVVWAFTQAPIALVTALRETSIVFSLLIGVFVLRERLDLLKVASTATTLAGVGLLRFARAS